jgi:hypothetical protein
MEILNECLQRRKLIVQQKEKARKEVESQVKIINRQNKRQWNQMKSVISKDIIKTRARSIGGKACHTVRLTSLKRLRRIQKHAKNVKNIFDRFEQRIEEEKTI